MMRRARLAGFAWLAWAAVLGGCADEPATGEAAPTRSLSTSPAAVASSAPAVSGVMAPLGALSPEALRPALAARRDGLAAVFATAIEAGRVTRPQDDGARVACALDSAALFEAGSSQLRPESLAMLARLAKWQRADGRIVLHVIGREPLQTVDDLAGRRAAAVGEFLIAEGALPVRLRAQGQTAALVAAPGAPRAAVDIVVVPVVEGREALAWTPPVN